METPPEGAGWLSVRIPVADNPPVSVAGESENPASARDASTVTVPWRETAPVVAVIVTGVVAETDCAASEKLAAFAPAGTATPAGA